MPSPNLPTLPPNSMAAAAAGVAAPSRGDDEWLRAYDRVVAMLPRVEALAAGRARLEAVNALQHEFWEARDALFQQRLLQEGESRRRLEAAYVDRQSSGSVDARRFAELQESDYEDLTTFVDALAAENTEFQIKLKEVDARAERSQNAADHEHITRDLEAELRNLKQAYETLCSEKDKEVSQLTAERDFSRYQFKTLERDYADLLSYGNKKEAQAAEAAQKLQQNVQQLQVASQKKDGEIRRLRAQAKAAEAKRKLVEGKLQNVYFMPKEIGGEVEKCKDRQPSASLDLVIPEGVDETVANLANPPATTHEPIVSPSAIPLISGEGCDISGLLTFDPESIEPAPSAANDEPRASAVLPQFQRLKALLSSPIEKLVEGSEEVKSVLDEIKDQLPVALQVKLWPVVTLSFYGSRVKLARERINLRHAQLPLKADIADKCQRLNEKKASLDAKTDTSVSIAELATLKKELEDLEEKVRATKQLIHDKEAFIARSQDEAEGLKAQLKTDLAEIRALNKQLVTGKDEDDEAEIAEVDRVRADALHAFEAFLQ